MQARYLHSTSTQVHVLVCPGPSFTFACYIRTARMCDHSITMGIARARASLQRTHVRNAGGKKSLPPGCAGHASRNPPISPHMAWVRFGSVPAYSPDQRTRRRRLMPKLSFVPRASATSLWPHCRAPSGARARPSGMARPRPRRPASRARSR